MNGKLVGALHKRGKFTNENTGELIEFDNVELVILTAPVVSGKFAPVSSIGLLPEKASKFPFSEISNVFGENVHEVSDLAHLIGKDIQYFYDGSKKICFVQALASSK